MAQKEPRGIGSCALIGCGGLLLLGVLIVGGLYFGSKYALRSFVDQYTSAQPAILPKTDMTPEEGRQLVDRVDAYKAQLLAGEAEEPLELTARELNGLLAYDPDFTNLSQRVYFTIDDDRLLGQISLSLDRMNLEVIKGRYLNAKVAFNFESVGGDIAVTIDEAEINDQALPEGLVNEFRKDNLAAEADPSVKRLLERIADIDVLNGKLIIQPKAVAEAEPVPEDPASEPEPEPVAPPAQL